MSRKAAFSLWLGLLGGCTLAPADHARVLPVPAVYPTQAPERGPRRAPQQMDWQAFFTDAALQKLLAIALRENRDLVSASYEIAQAEAQFRVQRSAILPTLNATGVGEYEGLSNSGLIGGQSTSSTAIPTGAGARTFQYYTASVGATSYQLDLFGKQRSLTRQAFQKYLAQADNLAAVRLTVIGNVANAYISWRADQALLRLTNETLRTQQDSLRITRASFDQHVTNLLTVRQNETAVATAQANLAQYSRQVAQDENQIALLIGAAFPTDLGPGAPLGAQSISADIPAGLPVDLLYRRPDIAQAEHVLQADNADIGAARAAFFPQISLTGSEGLSSLSFNKLFTPGSLTWSFAPQISVPIFTWGQTRANLDIAKTQQALDLAAYDKTVQSAFHDVANGLVARATYVAQLKAQQQNVDAAADYYRLSDMRFRAGVDTYLTALDAERTLYAAQQSLIATQSARAQNLVALYLALGGGWRAPEGAH